MSRWSLLVTLMFSAGCVDGVNQVAGTGATYATRCSANMLAKGEAYEAQCEPPPCARRFESVALSDVVVALDPGRKVVGYRERVCVQDLANASALFNPLLEAEEQANKEGATAP
ncbi:MAG: hypothetical protein JXX28_00995 [Deltaproteobacteria bacterium]|nr:hypothetical protein [Deltaproteobacteria bacterium]